MDELKVLSLLLLAVCIWGNPVKDFELTGEPNAETEVEESDNSGDENGELQKREEPSTMPNVGYLLQAYNIIKGNPLNPQGFDPGFSRLHIFAADYSEGKLTSDRRYKIPDNMDVTKEVSCTMKASAETLKTQKQYKDALNVKASTSVSGGTAVWQASFSASTEYNRVSNQLKTNDNSVIKSESTCTVYGAAVHDNPPPKFTKNFFNNVKDLQNDDPDYAGFLDKFGTHFIEKITMGSRYATIKTLSKANEEKLQSEGIDVDVTAAASLVGTVDAKVSTSVSKAKENMEKLAKSLQNEEEVAFGSKPPADGDPKTWMASAFEEPYPVYYRLKSILEIFKPQYFKDTPEVKYKEIRQGLQTFLKGYCRNFANRHPNLNVECEGPKAGCGGGSVCSANAVCEELPPGKISDHGDQQYSCKCKEGFNGNGVKCGTTKWIARGEIYHLDEKGDVGIWGGMQYCPDGVFADGFKLRAQLPSVHDNTGANSVCLICKDQYYCSKEGLWGIWSHDYKCPKGSFLYGWQQNVEWHTGIDNVRYRCKDLKTGQVTKEIRGFGYEWGAWSTFKECPKNQFICGINTRVAPWGGDDTALNDIRHGCCELDPSRKKAKKKKNQYGKKTKQ